MIVLGLNYGAHDPSAAVIDNGQLIAMVEQERICRIKRAPKRSPSDAVEFCLKQVDITPRDLDAIAIGWNIELFKKIPEPLPWSDILNNVRWALPKSFDSIELPIYYIRHHLAHAAAAFYTSGFKEAAILIVDGQGETESTSIAIGDCEGIRILHSFPISISLGHFYLAASLHAGFSVGSEGKFMGLAAYGIPDQPMPIIISRDGPHYVEELESVAKIQPLNTPMEKLHEWWTANNFPYARAELKKEPFAYSRFAASAQQTLEQMILFMAKKALELTNCKKLIVTGGVAQNCSANRVLTESKLFEEYFVSPISSDAGVSLGAGFVCASKLESFAISKIGSRMNHAYWGPSYNDQEIELALQASNIDHIPLSEDDLCNAVAELIMKNKIVGWFQGRAEIGPRALGARSILANPMIRANVSRINNLKGREEWRPLAPSVLAEEFDIYFRSELKSPFMNVAAEVRESVRSSIPAVTHVDGSARPQAVSRDHSPLFWKLLKTFKKYSGIGVLLNTSFNTWYEPIVNSPIDAIETFKKCNLDALAIGKYLIVL